MAEKDRVYRCLNPLGIENAVETFPLARRLDKVDGKEIYLSFCGEPDITLALERRLKNDYPNVNWKTKRTYVTDPIPLTDEEMKTADAVVQGVAW
jgi:hypothetical protein